MRCAASSSASPTRCPGDKEKHVALSTDWCGQFTEEVDIAIEYAQANVGRALQCPGGPTCGGTGRKVFVERFKCAPSAMRCRTSRRT
jgi:hypothetical protein